MSLQESEFLRQVNAYKAARARLWPERRHLPPMSKPPAELPKRTVIAISRLAKKQPYLVNVSWLPIVKKPGQPTIKEIVQFVAVHYGVSVIDIKSDRRTADIVRPRHVAMYLSRLLTPRSLPEIGRYIGKRDHTTALHACTRISALLASDPKFAADIDSIKTKIVESA